jgi:hypothetical protein
VFLPQSERPRFISIQHNRQNYSFIWFWLILIYENSFTQSRVIKCKCMDGNVR